MPVFQETSNDQRDLRILPSRERPLPRLTPRATTASPDKHEVVVIGAGPAGMMLTLSLARYGLGDVMKCYDGKAGTLKAGQADGLQPRTLEVLKSLDIAEEIVNHGCHMSEVGFWNPTPDKKSIERTSFAPDVVVPARYKHEVTIHQGRIERIMEANMNEYSTDCIQRSTKFIEYQMDAAGDAEYPVKITLEQDNGCNGKKTQQTVRSKYLVGADGAHSGVRRCMGLHLEGETTDFIWGVVDFVAETDFPDVRKRCAIHSDAGSVMIIPRERIYSGQFLTRLYVQMKEEVPASESDPDSAASREASKSRRSAITLPVIMEQARRVFAPYSIDLKKNTVVDWWAAYQIGQRMCPNFCVKDEAGQERVFIVGDACHTHSPKAGQGMNVSMMDSYNLGWKLAYKINGLSPEKGNDGILATYESERAYVAKLLIEFDTKFSHMFSGQIGAEDSAEALTHDQFLKVFSDGSGFTSGCGIEYSPGRLVQAPASGGAYPVKGEDYLSGVLKPGRRLLDSVVRRYADANLRHLHDDFLSTGRFRILVFATSDIVEAKGVSSRALTKLCEDVIPSYPEDLVELVVLHPFQERKFEWTEISRCVKDMAEMRLHGPVTNGLYKTYGVGEDSGAIVVVRPDGYVGAVVALSDASQADDYLSRCIIKTT